MGQLYRFENGELEGIQGEVVREFPLVLKVNGRELATLVASPHDLRFLVAGFLRLQGFVTSVDDFLMLGICSDFGVANVRIRGEVPERLKPTLTSGCGAGITFNLPQSMQTASREGGKRGRRFFPGEVFALMDELTRRAESYRSHGGIHSAAVGDGKSLLFHAEDIGRHNTVDRIAGEALLKNADLSGAMLVTSGRVSSEMAAKAALMGITLIASRTSPTDMAVRMCDEAGITLIGYVRGGRFTVYSHPEGLATKGVERLVHNTFPPSRPERIPGVTGVILAGGTSSRMGSNKALLPYRGGRFIEAIHRRLAEQFHEVILVTNAPEQYDFLPCRKVPDLFPGMGALAGIHSGLRHSVTPYIFVAACDMPHLNAGLIRYLASLAGEDDAVVPEGGTELEPLHALYGKGCLPSIEGAFASGDRRIVSFFDRVRVRRVSSREVAAIDPAFASFRNINTPDDYFSFREEDRTGVTGVETASRGRCAG